MKIIVLLTLLTAKLVFADVMIVTSIKPLSDIAKEIGKDKVKTDYIIPPNINYHLYEYKPQDLKKIYKADLFVFVGSGEPSI
ncbi:MAG TPA: zinc ABC transporter substrate-binding protein, partial [Sulfurihydrogenibium azorense]|nr:zinc ABC transporter substrate-binding protein [Sulfurihydrogenibium azorense]